MLFRFIDPLSAGCAGTWDGYKAVEILCYEARAANCDSRTIATLDGLMAQLDDAAANDEKRGELLYQIDTLEEEIAELEAKVAQLEKDNESLSDSLDTLRDRINEMESDAHNAAIERDLAEP